MRQTTCLVINPTSVDSYASLFNCTTTGQASDSMTASTKSFHKWLGLDAMSLVWPTVVQLVVSFNSGLQWGLAKSTLSLFRHSDGLILCFR